MNSRFLVAIFGCFFLSTIAVTMWQREPGSRSDPGQSAERFSRQPGAAGPMTIGAMAPGQSAAAGGGADGTDGGSGAPITYPDYHEADAPRDPAVQEVPVIVDVEDASVPGQRTTIIRNLTPQSLDVRVTSINPATGSRSVVETALPPRRRTNLTDLGLVVVDGARIVVESPPFLEQTTTVH